MDETDRRILRALQDGLPLEAEPYAAIARQLGLGTDALLGRVQAMLDRGEVRRFAASIAHRRAGIAANVMCVWRVAPDEVERVARVAVEFDAVSHCYERDPAPDWPYTFYAMIHGRAERDCQAVIDAICQRTGQADYVALQSTREFKKTWTRL